MRLLCSRWLTHVEVRFPTSITSFPTLISKTEMMDYSNGRGWRYIPFIREMPEGVLDKWWKNSGQT